MSDSEGDPAYNYWLYVDKGFFFFYHERGKTRRIPGKIHSFRKGDYIAVEVTPAEHIDGAEKLEFGANVIATKPITPGYERITKLQIVFGEEIIHFTPSEIIKIRSEEAYVWEASPKKIFFFLLIPVIVLGAALHFGYRFDWLQVGISACIYIGFYYWKWGFSRLRSLSEKPCDD